MQNKQLSFFHTASAVGLLKRGRLNSHFSGCQKTWACSRIDVPYFRAVSAVDIGRDSTAGWTTDKSFWFPVGTWDFCVQQSVQVGYGAYLYFRPVGAAKCFLTSQRPGRKTYVRMLDLCCPHQYSFQAWCLITHRYSSTWRPE